MIQRDVHLLVKVSESDAGPFFQEGETVPWWGDPEEELPEGWMLYPHGEPIDEEKHPEIARKYRERFGQAVYPDLRPVLKPADEYYHPLGGEH